MSCFALKLLHSTHSEEAFTFSPFRCEHSGIVDVGMVPSSFEPEYSQEEQSEEDGRDIECLSSPMALSASRIKVNLFPSTESTKNGVLRQPGRC